METKESEQIPLSPFLCPKAKRVRRRSFLVIGVWQLRGSLPQIAISVSSVFVYRIFLRSRVLKPQMSELTFAATRKVLPRLLRIVRKVAVSLLKGSI
jgi:hypothetical protein